MYIIRNFSSEGLSSYECFLVLLTKLDQRYLSLVIKGCEHWFNLFYISIKWNDEMENWYNPTLKFCGYNFYNETYIRHDVSSMYRHPIINQPKKIQSVNYPKLMFFYVVNSNCIIFWIPWRGLFCLEVRKLVGSWSLCGRL